MIYLLLNSFNQKTKQNKTKKEKKKRSKIFSFSKIYSIIILFLKYCTCIFIQHRINAIINNKSKNIQLNITEQTLNKNL